MKKKLYRKLKQCFIMLSICLTLLAGPAASNEVSKMLKNMDERNAVIREYNDEDNNSRKLKVKE